MDLTLVSIVAGLGLTELLLTGGLPPLVVLIHRSAVCVALAIALIARSRRWDWFAVVIVAAAYALRLFTQVAK